MTTVRPSAPVGREEERLLLRYHRYGDIDSRQKLIQRFIPLAKGLARRYAHLDDVEDLEQVACVGLMRAVDRFDPERGTPFVSYAAPSIIGELKRHIRDRAWAVRVPRSLQERSLSVAELTNRLSGELRRSPTVREVAAEMGASVEDVLEAAEAGAAYSAVGLEGAGPDDAAAPIEHLGTDDERYEQVESLLSIAPAFAALPLRERVVLELRFGRDMTQSEIGAELGVSQMQVCRLLRYAVERMRAAVSEAA